MPSSQPRPSSKPASHPAPPDSPCLHPRVELVARDEDVEFVACRECGEIFEASEFKDMANEERIKQDQA